MCVCPPRNDKEAGNFDGRSAAGPLLGGRLSCERRRIMVYCSRCPLGRGNSQFVKACAKERRDARARNRAALVVWLTGLAMRREGLNVASRFLSALGRTVAAC